MSKTNATSTLMAKVIHNLKTIKDIDDIIPVKPVATGAAGGVGLGVLASILTSKDPNKKLKDNIKLYQAIESPNAHEEDIIDENIYKESKLAYDIPTYVASAAVPGYVALDYFKDKAQKKKTDEGRKEIGMLRDKVNAAYRKDLMSAYGVEDENMLKELVADIKSKAESLDKEAAIFDSVLSTPAALVGGTATGMAAFLVAKNLADKSNPARKTNKAYLSSLDKLYRERLVSPTIRSLPFSEEEILAMELYKQNKGKKLKAPVVDEESATPLELNNTQDVDMDSEDIQSIMKEL